MLKKVGIVVAAGAATMVALSPLAFAGEGKFNGNDVDVTRTTDVSNVAVESSKGLINVSGNNVDISRQTCGNVGSNNDILGGILGGLAGAKKDGEASADIDAQKKTDNSINCTQSTSGGAGDELTQTDGETESSHGGK